MSNWLLLVGIPAGILAFYPIVYGLAQLPVLQRKPQLLKYLHLGSWGLALGLLVVFIKWELSLRGQWWDNLPFGLAWLTAGTYFWLRRRQMQWFGKLYFGSWFAYPAALVLAYLADKIFFALVSLPIIVFLPTPSYYSSDTLTIRAPVSGFLSAPRLLLLEPVGGVWEKHLGLAYGDQVGQGADSIQEARILASSRRDSIAVLLTTPGGQRVVRFGR